MVTLICPCPTYVDGIFVPFHDTVEAGRNGPPPIVRIVVVFVGPALDERVLSVGTGGISIGTAMLSESPGFEVELYTLTVAVPGDASRLAGTDAPISELLPDTAVCNGLPFHSTTEVEVKFEPWIVRVVFPSPT
jgi:hypothetical protein